MEKYIEIGFSGKTHGVKGELKFSVEDAYWEDFEQADVLFLDVAGRKTPYFVDYIKSGNLLLVKFEDVSSKEAANALANRPVFMRQQDVNSGTIDAVRVEDMFDLLPGYFIKQTNGTEVGEIKEVLEFPQQIMAVVSYAGKEIFIPLNDVFIKAIDQAKGTILMELPDGLLDL